MIFLLSNLFFTDLLTRIFCAALTGFFVVTLSGSAVIKKLYKWKASSSTRLEDCPFLAQLHEKKRAIPQMGGLLILAAIFLSVMVWSDLTSSFTLILSIALFWLGIVGAYDDYLKLKHRNSKGMGGKKKLLAQLVLGLAVGIYGTVPGFAEKIAIGNWFLPPMAQENIALSLSPQLPLSEYMCQYYLPFCKEAFFQLGGFWIISGILFTAIVIAGSSNGVNLSDGLDGLATGLLVSVAAVFTLVAFCSSHSEISAYLETIHIEGSGEIAVFLAALLGACLGFLWYNGYPAQVFMGDTGSLPLGGILGVAAVLLRREFLLALVGGVFVVEVLSVMMQVLSYRLRNGKKIFLCSPLHHHFEYKGWHESKLVIRFWMVAFLLALIGIFSFIVG